MWISFGGVGLASISRPDQRFFVPRSSASGGTFFVRSGASGYIKKNTQEALLEIFLLSPNHLLDERYRSLDFAKRSLIFENNYWL